MKDSHRERLQSGSTIQNWASSSIGGESCGCILSSADGIEHTLYLHGPRPLASRETFRLIVSESARTMIAVVSG
jgi:uncharacterized protein (DUF927 family)